MAKTMKLTWFGPRKGWKKLIKGRLYYFALGKCKDKDDQDGYIKALIEYRQLTLKLDPQNGQKTENSEVTLPDGSSIDLSNAASLNVAALRKEYEKERERAGIPVSRKYSTIYDLMKAYLAARKSDVARGELSMGSYSSDHYRLKTFRQYCEGTDKHLSIEAALNPKYLDEYKDFIQDCHAKNKIGPIGAKHTLRTAKAFAQWAYDRSHIDTLPRNLRTYAKITLPSPRPQFFSVKEIKRLYKDATDRLKLYIVLSLNTGWTQADLSSFEHGMIDWNAGMVSRPRHKTGIPSEAKLWPVTLDLLKKQATDPNKSERVLLTESGQPLVRQSIKENGLPSRTDFVSHTFNILKKKLHIEPGFKCLRKTGAEEINKKFSDKQWIKDLYLAHSTQGISKHYVTQDFAALHEATDWLSTIYGFDKLTPEDSGEATEDK